MIYFFRLFHFVNNLCQNDSIFDSLRYLETLLNHVEVLVYKFLVSLLLRNLNFGLFYHYYNDKKTKRVLYPQNNPAYKIIK